ncbi:MAG: sulfatase-like hydrolase/transferase [Phycisphaerales bacterium JB041]
MPAVLLAACLLVNAANAQIRNVVMIVADDQRADTIAAWGNEHIETPNLDALTARGTSFTNAYCMGSMTPAVCAPSRAMFLSGRTLLRVGPDPYNTGPDVRLLPEVLRESGLTTFATGKWHNGKASFARAFDDGASIFFGGMGSHTTLPVHDFDPDGSYPAGSRRSLREFSSSEFASAAAGFLRSDHADAPFFLYLSFTAPHDPRTPPEPDLARYRDNPPPLPANFRPVERFDNGEMTIRDEALAPWPRTEATVREHLADYYAMITHMDRQIGLLLAAIDETGRADDTLIVFFADHGLAVGSHGLLGKQNLYEHSTKAPLIVAGPGVARGAAIAAPVYLLDVPATVCDMLSIDASWCPESESFADALRGRSFAGRGSILTLYRTHQRAVRKDNWKLIRYPLINHTQLFDLESDPDETHNFADDPAQAGRVVELLGELGRWQERIGDPHPLSTHPPRARHFDHAEAERNRRGG